MARLIERLTETKIRTLPNGFHPDGRGLYLQVQERSQSWIFRFTLNKRTRDMGLGGLAELSLVEARATAAEQRVLVAKGIDPIEHRAASHVGAIIRQSGPTFEQIAEKADSEDKFYDLENQICDLNRAARIAMLMVIHAEEVGGDEEELRWFAIAQVDRLAAELKASYYKAYDEGRDVL